VSLDRSEIEAITKQVKSIVSSKLNTQLVLKIPAVKKTDGRDSYFDKEKTIFLAKAHLDYPKGYIKGIIAHEMAHALLTKTMKKWLPREISQAFACWCQFRYFESKRIDYSSWVDDMLFDIEYSNTFTRLVSTLRRRNYNIQSFLLNFPTEFNRIRQCPLSKVDYRILEFFDEQIFPKRPRRYRVPSEIMVIPASQYPKSQYRPLHNRGVTPVYLSKRLDIALDKVIKSLKKMETMGLVINKSEQEHVIIKKIERTRYLTNPPSILNWVYKNL